MEEGVLGIRIQGRLIVGSAESTELPMVALLQSVTLVNPKMLPHFDGKKYERSLKLE